MRRSLFGYKVSDVTVAMSAIREENESLNATIISLKTHIKNLESGNNAKAILLENDLRTLENNLKEVSEEKDKLTLQIDSLKNEIEAMKQENEGIASQLEQANKEKEELRIQINSQNQYITEVLANNSELTEKNRELEARIEEGLTSGRKELEAAKEEAAAAREELSDQMCHGMPRLRKEAMDYLSALLKEYDQNDKDDIKKMRVAIEQCQAEYNQRICDFNHKVSEFRSSLAKLDHDLYDMTHDRLSIEKLDSRRKELIVSLIEEGKSALVKKRGGYEAAKITRDAKPYLKKGNNSKVFNINVFRQRKISK
jgi:chromosome segregation ATPase